MFRTHISCSLETINSDSSCFHWSCIEHCLALPWFYVSLADKAENALNDAMLQIMDPTVLIELLQSARVEKILLVTPPSINKSNEWKMETLIRFFYLQNKLNEGHEAYEVDNGNIYALIDPPKNERENPLKRKLIYEAKEASIVEFNSKL